MIIEWNKDLETGITVVDNQHKELFRRIDGFMQACKAGAGGSEMNKVIKFLEVYVLLHFSDEEKLMRANSYPGLEEHIKQHKDFVANLNEMKDEIKEKGAGSNTISSVNTLIVEWLNNHIKLMDQEFGEFMKGK